MKQFIMIALLLCISLNGFADDKKVLPDRRIDPKLLQLSPDLIVASLRYNHSPNGWILSGVVYNCGHAEAKAPTIHLAIVGYKWIHPKKRHQRVLGQEITVRGMMKPGVYHKFSVNLGRTLMPGRDMGYILVVVDSKKAVKEYNEANNIGHEFLRPVE